MISLKYDFDFLFKLVKYVFIPVLALALIMAIVIFVYSKHVKKKDIEHYNYLVEFWTTLLAILVIGGLFAITIGFAISLTNTIKNYDLVETYKIIYYLVLATPLVPFFFLVYYIYRIVVTVSNKPDPNEYENNIEEVENPEVEDTHESIDEVEDNIDQNIPENESFEKDKDIVSDFNDSLINMVKEDKEEPVEEIKQEESIEVPEIEEKEEDIEVL